MSEGKLDFAGKAWVDKATQVLEALVNEHGEEEETLRSPQPDHDWMGDLL